MKSVDNTKNEGISYRKNDLNMQIPSESRKTKLWEDKHPIIVSKDTHEGAPSVEYYNNYSKEGLLVSDCIASQMDDVEVSAANSVDYVSSSETKLSDTHLLIARLTKNLDGERIEEYMNQGIRDYFAGKIGADEMADIAKRMYEDILALNIAAGKTDGNDPSFNVKLLEHTHSIFSVFAVDTLYWDMYDIGFKYAQESYGFTRSEGDRFCYYDADYYYTSKELQDIGDAAFTSIAKDEGLSGFRAADLYNGYPACCFNSKWNSFAGPGNAAASLIKDVNIAPPRGFKLFFSPNRYSQEARDNGAYYTINAINPNPQNGDTGATFYIKVPKGAEMWRPMPFWMTLTKISSPTGKDYVRVTEAFDISKYIKPGAEFRSSLQDFFDKYVNNLDAGVLTIWSGDTVAEYDVPFNPLFEGNKQFNGSQLVPSGAYNGFLSNFEFGIFLQSDR